MENIQHLTDEEIALCAEAMSDGKLSSVPAHMRNHLQLCDTCFHETSIIVDIITNQEKNSIPIKEDKKTISFPKMGLWLSIAASLTLLLMLTIVYPGKIFKNKQVAEKERLDSSQNSNSTNPTLIFDKNQTIAPASQKENNLTNPIKTNSVEKEKSVQVSSNMLAYAPHPPLEELVNRSANAALRGDDIKITTPTQLKTSLNQLKLEWKNTETSLMYVEIYDNTGQNIYKTETNASSISIQSITKPGRYYWKLINEDFDLLFCGVIIIEK